MDGNVRPLDPIFADGLTSGGMGRKTCVLTTTDTRKSASNSPTRPDSAVAFDLQPEVDRLTGQVAVLTNQLRRALNLADDVDVENLDLDALEKSRAKDNPYVFDTDDSGVAAFDSFFNTYDPHLEKTRSFLLE